MAHIAKYSKGAMGHMLSHYDRSKNNLSGDIDKARTVLNYNLGPVRAGTQLDFIHQRLSEVKVQQRKDVNVLCDWVVTVPKDLPLHEHKAFFQHTYNFLQQKYGAENVISAYVHIDETTPHMHFAFIPVVPDKRRGGFKVSAKEAITRSDLQQFHERLQTYLEDQLGHPVSILNEATRNGNKSIAELKRQSAVERLQAADAQAMAILDTAKDKAQAAKERYDAMYAEWRGVYEGVNQWRDAMRVMDDIREQTKKLPNWVRVKRNLMGQQSVIISMDKWNEICGLEQGALYQAMQRIEANILQQMHNIEKTSKMAHVHALERSNEGLQKEIEGLQQQINQLQQQVDEAQKYNSILQKRNANIRRKTIAILKNLSSDMPDIEQRFQKMWEDREDNQQRRNKRDYEPGI